MLSIKIICVGELSQQYWKLATNDYLTRVKKQANIIIQNIKESKLNLITVNINIESNKIIEYLDKNIDYQWMLLDLTGNLVTSEQLAQIIVKNQNYQQGKIGFIIGGSNGVNQELKANSKLIKIAFGKITLPHQLCYVVLLEQIYRSLQIINNQPYHK
ncbi:MULTISPECIES: 23S rRNA (pseudouridine(1915)-N(3))-methyltransferase RlmH [unclassified Spiroplasma]|uniref:23S rRNA (pseudouridine(1915)-N(3))-methyltransferase RlmH n=1 Tax=unclassified Spiroplasma TaxID=2637901 RepID=UPI0027DEE6D4|nr:23S rRNA (pseudouridine(1915)-N(3))-methyltransferase RlmH [Spiroplasma sp. AdecLV25b]